MILTLLYLFSILYFSDHLFTVHYLTTKQGFELNPFINIIWDKFGIYGFVFFSLFVWAGFTLVYYSGWDKMGWVWKGILYVFIAIYFLLNLNHIFHYM